METDPNSTEAEWRFLALVPQLGSWAQVQWSLNVTAKAGAQHPAGGSRAERGRPARAALPGLGSKGLTGWGRREQQSFG